MKPSEWVDGWFSTYRGEGYEETGDREALDKILALLEAVEGCCVEDLSDDIRFMEVPMCFESIHILRSALTLKGV